MTDGIANHPSFISVAVELPREISFVPIDIVSSPTIPKKRYTYQIPLGGEIQMALIH